jgi:uncharacterized membrane protein
LEASKVYRHNRRLVVALAAAVILLSGGTTAAAAAPAAPRQSGGDPVRLASPWPGNQTIIHSVSDRGDIAGTAVDPDLGDHPGLWRRYDRFTDLTDLGPGAYTTAVNNRGHVVGGGPDSLPGTGFLYRDGEVTVLSYPSGSGVTPADINDRDQVVGHLRLPNGGGTYAFIWENGVFTLLPNPPGMHSYAVAVNNRGQMTGYLVNADWSVARPFVWSGGAITYLGTLGGSYDIPMDINERGQVVGGGLLPNGINHPFLWTRGRLVDLLPGQPTTVADAHRSNDAGVIVGVADGRPVLWRDGRMRYLTPSGYTGWAADINNRGEIAGSVSRAGADPEQPGFRQAFRWSAQGLTMLNLPGEAAEARAGWIDDRGRVVGTMYLIDGPNVGVVWVR